jgi:hypothetical protein
MSDASDFLTKWVRKNITPTTAHIRDDTLTAGRLAEECLWESQAENLSAAPKTSYCCLVQRFAASGFLRVVLDCQAYQHHGK